MARSLRVLTERLPTHHCLGGVDCRLSPVGQLNPQWAVDGRRLTTGYR
eukprot:CAMPEP_0171116268 /NCGR_PEP_ID=MMETSP0766_2-20121228/89909_1 /TAXON_ID=439317 /ORGANISM="Gambierdiscus australes, Strain CAWD 149" /LENGTH=47 /DNA_ID= /DNA_START= /DNA_END= /DNA_ORIENTATION=